MLKSTDLRERSVQDLTELEKTLAKDLFQNRFKNFTNRLDDTSLIRKSRRELARIRTVLLERTRAAEAHTLSTSPQAGNQDEAK